MPAWISNEEIHGPIPNAQYNALQVWGSYNNALIIKSNYMPRYYAALVATGGPNSDSNPVGFREHVNTAHQGLRHIPGRGPYPIQESFFARGFDSRHRLHKSVAGLPFYCYAVTRSGWSAALPPGDWSAAAPHGALRGCSPARSPDRRR